MSSDHSQTIPASAGQPGCPACGGPLIPSGGCLICALCARINGG